MILRKASTVRVAAAAVLAATAACLSGLVLVGLQAGGPAPLRAAPLVRIAGGYDREAVRRLERRTADLDAALAASRTALSLAPYDTSAWLRVAYIDALRDGRLGADGVQALRRSYDLVGLDSDQALWRVGFAVDHWTDLPPDVRSTVAAEKTALQHSVAHRRLLADALRETHDPAGRLVAAIWLAELK